MKANTLPSIKSSPQHGGARPGAGRRKGTVKGRKDFKHIKVEESTFKELSKMKKQAKSKTWTEFLLSLINKSSLS